MFYSLTSSFIVNNLPTKYGTPSSPTFKLTSGLITLLPVKLTLLPDKLALNLPYLPDKRVIILVNSFFLSIDILVF